MFTTRRAIVVAALWLGGTAVAAPSAFAAHVHDAAGGQSSIPQAASDGSPIWVFVLVAVLAMLVTVAITLTTLRLRPAFKLAGADHLDAVRPMPAAPIQHQAPHAPVDA
jgi:hypothetical protein